MKNLIANHNVIIFFELSKILIKNTKNFKFIFVNFLKKHNLKVYNLFLKETNIFVYLDILQNLKKSKETIGDIILSNFNFYK